MENERTQPARRHRVFNNPRALAEGWYPVCAAKTLRSNKPVSFKLLGQRLAVFRDAQGRPRALDAFCPHMGADLANGSVDGGGLRCFFHGWRFGGDGCLDRASCGEAPAGDVRLNSYPCEEKYGHVWVYAAREAPGGVPSPAGLEGESVSVLRESSALLAHHHLMMANGIDLRHFGSVHGLPVAFEHRVVERGGGVFDWEVEGAIRGEGLLKKIIGPKLGYVARFAGGSWVAVTYLPDHRVLPALHIVWGCEPLESGVSRVRVSRRQETTGAPRPARGVVASGRHGRASSYAQGRRPQGFREHALLPWALDAGRRLRRSVRATDRRAPSVAVVARAAGPRGPAVERGAPVPVRKPTLQEWFLAHQLRSLWRGHHYFPVSLDVDVSRVEAVYRERGKPVPYTAIVIKALAVAARREPSINRMYLPTILGPRMVEFDHVSVNLPVVVEKNGERRTGAATIRDADRLSVKEIRAAIREARRRRPEDGPVGRFVHGRANNLFNRLRLRAIHFAVYNFPGALAERAGGLSVTSVIGAVRDDVPARPIGFGPTAFTIAVSHVDRSAPGKTVLRLGIGVDHAACRGDEAARGVQRFHDVLSAKDDADLALLL